jgi:hypothetical protein
LALLPSTSSASRRILSSAASADTPTPSSTAGVAAALKPAVV